MNKRTGIIMGLVSIILMALSAPFQKLASGSLDALQLSFFSNLFAGIACLIWMLHSKATLRFKLGGHQIILILLYACAQVSFSFALTNEHPIIVSFIARFYLVFSFLFSVFLLKEPIQRKAILGIIIILLGVFLVAAPSDELKLIITPGVLAAGLYAFLFSLHNSKLKTRPEFNNTQLILYQCLGAAIILGFVQIFTSSGITEKSLPSIGWTFLAGTVSTFLGFACYQVSIRNLSLAGATSLRSISPIVATLIIFPLYPIAITSKFLIGSGLTLFGCVLVHHKSSKGRT